MPAEGVDIEGDLLEPETLSVAKARELVRRLITHQIPFAVYLESRSGNGLETVVMDIEVEVPQRPVHDIRQHERIAVRFDPADARAPEVMPLRSDFPTVPHLNITRPGDPKSICLFEDYRENRPRLTAPLLVERIREWLRLTARGDLHAADQPLEPLLVGVGGRIIVPHAIISPRKHGDPPIALTVSLVKDGGGGLVLIAERATKQSIAEHGPPFAATVFWAAPRPHGVLTIRPGSLEALHGYLNAGGDDLLGHLREALIQWQGTPEVLDARLVLVVVAPKTRDGGGQVESHDLWAFFTGKKVREVGISVGVFQDHEGVTGRLLPVDEKARGQDVEIHLLNASITMSRDAAAYYSGRTHADDRAFVGIGAGALGSQVALNAARIGFGRWTLVDADLILPHNVARHAVATEAVGYSKALAVSEVANRVTDSDKPAFEFINADVLDPGTDADALNERMVSADVIVDMSASIPVARYLGRDAVASARRLSLFLNPTGTDLVLLCESRDRSIRLDSIEMQYYRALLQDHNLAKHLEPPTDRIRYGRSCRDVSVRISQELVAQHAGNGTRAIRAATERDGASIRIWRLNPETGEVAVHEVPVEPTVVYRVEGWTVVMDNGLLRRIAALRLSKLPRETGGVLLGSFDLEKRIVYVVDTIPSPPDSEERPTWFIRGSEGLPAEVAGVTITTGEQAEYIGEWHSHPKGYSCRPSEDDAKLFAWLTNRMDLIGLPALMMIAGDEGDLAVFVGEMAIGELRDEHRIAIVNGVIRSPACSS